MKEQETLEEREREDEEDGLPGSAGAGAADALVFGAGNGAALSDNPAAMAYLAAQTRLLGVQFEHMHEQRILILGHLRVRWWRERLQLALQLLLGALAGLVIVAVLSFAFLTMRDEANVIEPFKAAPALTAQGLDGAVMATKLLDGVRTLVSQTDTARAPSTMRGAGEEEIKVEIPETGVSVGELLKYLRLLFGHERHISGDAYYEGDDLVITVRTGDEPGRTFRGPKTDLEPLMAKASEAVFEGTQPYLYSVYLSQHGRANEALEVAKKLAVTGPRRERGWAYAHWANLLIHRGDNAAAVIRARQALAQDPHLVTADRNLASASFYLGHAEAAYEAWRAAYNLLRGGRRATITGSAADQTRSDASEAMDEALGDYADAAALARRQLELPDYSGDAETAKIFLADDYSEAHDTAAAEAILRKGGFDTDLKVLSYMAGFNGVAWPVADLDAARGDWSAAAQDLEAVRAWLPEHEPLARDALTRHVEPALAQALAHLGRFAEADALLGGSPLDCDPCVRARGLTAALEGRPQEADGWYARVVARTPSLPRPLTDWGEVLLARGDAVGAARKAEAAHRLSPRSPDGYELWGRALLKLGRREEAAAKLAEAVRLAPAWTAARQELAAAQSPGRRPV